MAGVHCQSCGRELGGDDVVFLLESSDILCDSCGEGYVAFMGDGEVAEARVLLEDVHEDHKREGINP